MKDMNDNAQATGEVKGNPKVRRRNRFIALVTAGVLCVTAVAVGLGVGLGGISGPDLEAAINTSPLFAQNVSGGGVNGVLINQLQQLADTVGVDSRAESHVHNVNNPHFLATANTYVAASANEIRAASAALGWGNALPNVQLFQPLPNDGSTAGIAHHLTATPWQLTKISRPFGGGEPVFTFYARNAVANSTFGSANNWNTQTVIPNMLNNAWSVINPHFTIANPDAHIVRPNALPGLWQTTGQQQTHHANGPALMTAARAGDRMWIPSAAEVGDAPGTAGTNGRNIWNLTANTAERGYVVPGGSGFNSSAWLRSANTTSNVRMVDTAGGVNSSNPGDTRSVRPALHLSLSNLDPTGSLINAGFSGAAGNPGRVSVPAEGVIPSTILNWGNASDTVFAQNGGAMFFEVVTAGQIFNSIIINNREITIHGPSGAPVWDGNIAQPETWSPGTGFAIEGVTHYRAHWVDHTRRRVWVRVFNIQTTLHITANIVAVS